VTQGNSNSHHSQRTRRPGRVGLRSPERAPVAPGSPVVLTARRAEELVRHAAAARLERRETAGVVVVAHVREEQELLAELALIVERGTPLTAGLFAAVEQLARETTPPRLPGALRNLRTLLAESADLGGE
jgi:hypothetical protein